MSDDDELRFDRLVLRPAAREVLVDGRAAPLGARAFDLLLALAERAGEVVTRDELFERAWPGRVVVDDNLKVQVMALRKLLGAQAIVTAPGRGYRLALAPRAQAPAAPAPALFGREGDLARIEAAWAGGARLVTLVGPGGVGKTRLAQAALEHAPSALRAAVATAELATIADPAALPALVAKAFELPAGGGKAPSIESVARALSPLSALLLLDNCEHLAADAARLAAALQREAPGVFVLATSQQPLGLARETVLRIEGLALEPADGHTLSAAEALLVARTRALDARFDPGPEQRAALRDICLHLEGLPLALELAAARVPLLGLVGVRERLDQQLQLLTRGAGDAPPRQRTLRAALQWSHALLDDGQREALRRLAVFADSFTLETAAPVLGLESDASGALLDLLDALTARSLLQTVDLKGQRRLRLPSATRAFALERLAESGELAATQARHADAVAQRFEHADEALMRLPRLHWLDRYEPELPELRAALRWAARPDGDARRLLRLVGAAGRYWAMASLDSEAAPWIERARALADEPDTPKALVARYWLTAAWRSNEPTAPIQAAVEAAERAAELYLELGDTPMAYRMLGVVAQHARRVQPPRDADAVIERMRALEQPGWPARLPALRARVQAIARARARDWAAYGEWARMDAQRQREAGDEIELWGALHHVALAEIALGRPDEAVRALEPAVKRIRELGLLRALWTRPAILLVAQIEAGARQELAPSVREVSTLLRVAGAPAWIAPHHALWAAQCGHAPLAAQLLGWSDASFERRGEAPHAHARVAEARTLEQLGTQLDASRIEALRAEGRALSDELALWRVCEIGAPAQSSP